MEELFRVLLRAPLHNPRWSWGAVRDLDQAVFLRVWEDEKIRHDDKWYMRLTAHAHFATDPNNKGWQERLRHLALVQNGGVAYMVMCEAVDMALRPARSRASTSARCTKVEPCCGSMAIGGSRWSRVGRFMTCCLSKALTLA